MESYPVHREIDRVCAFCAIVLALAAPAGAHHSAAAYDTQKEVKVSGNVVRYRFANPHVYLTIQVKNPDGSTSTIEVEAGAASVLNGLGFTSDSVSVGDVVTIVGNPDRRNPAILLGRDLHKRDESYLPLNIGSRSVYQGKSATATSIAGTWFSPRSEFVAYTGSVGTWKLTDKGRSAAANVDPKATTQKDCIPVTAPTLMLYPVANTIVVEREADLSELAETGIRVDARISTGLLMQIFTPSGPLHDGAVIIQQGRISAAAVFLPLTQNPRLDPSLGTRHRAGVGATAA